MEDKCCPAYRRRCYQYRNRLKALLASPQVQKTFVVVVRASVDVVGVLEACFAARSSKPFGWT